MRALVEKLWVRLLALALFFLFSVGALFAFYLYSGALEDGWFGKEDYTFADTGMAKSYALNALGFVAENLSWLGDPNDSSLGGYGGSAFSYQVEDYVTGELYADTTGANSYFVAEYPRVVSPASDDGDYRLYGYVNLPVQPYGGCYREYYIFEQLFPLRHLFLPFGIALTLLTLASLGIAIASAVCLGKRGVLTLLGQVPFDGAAAGLYIAAVVSWELICDLLPYTFFDVAAHFGIVTQSLKRVFMIWYAGLLALILASQLTARQWTKKLLVCRAAKHLSPGVVLAVVFIVHLAMLLAVLAPYTGYFDFFEPLYLLLNYNTSAIHLALIGFDIAALILAILWNRERKHVSQAIDALAGGELNHKLDAKRLHFSWHHIAQDVNSIGDGMAAAVEERLRSERMKTELITNVSHDLKTPLTSIINYISLLKEKDLSPETQQEYLDVLDRQSAKLKKLTEDVVEASKAASGVMPVHAELLDVTELLEQSVGEYTERLEAANIEPVIHTPGQEVYVFADGRLLGRVLDNFITNIIKYAQPGTRAYFDLAAGQSATVIAVKNTSRAPLDIPAEELMERFVRGDSSRSSEGSGLGLSIARSLTELMGGQLQLTLDGDLFKAEVTFPTAQPPLLAQPPEGQTPAETTETTGRSDVK